LDSFDNQTCIDCHGENDQVFMTEHVTQFGTGCMNCHDGVDRLSNFRSCEFFHWMGSCDHSMHRLPY
jgi:hypothetical protein